MRFSEWRAKAPYRESVSDKVDHVVEAALTTFGADRDPECWVAWGDDPSVRYLLLAPTPGGLIQLNVRVNVPGEGPRASGKVVRWSRVQLGELGVEIQGGHRLVTFQVDTQVLNGVDESADRIADFAQSLFAAVDGRPHSPPTARATARRAPAAGRSGATAPRDQASERCDRQAHAEPGDEVKTGAGRTAPAAGPDATRDPTRPRRAPRPGDQPAPPDDPLLALAAPRRRPDAGVPAGPARRSGSAAARSGDLLLQPPELVRPVRADGRPAVPAAAVVLRAEGGGHAGRRAQPGHALDRAPRSRTSRARTTCSRRPGGSVRSSRPAASSRSPARAGSTSASPSSCRSAKAPPTSRSAPACRSSRSPSTGRAGCASAGASGSGWGSRCPSQGGRTARRSPSSRRGPGPRSTTSSPSAPDVPEPGRVGRWLTERFNDWPEGSREAARAASAAGGLAYFDPSE